jgi:hypothetical protein
VNTPKPPRKITQEDSAFFWRANVRTIQRWEGAGVNPANAMQVADLYNRQGSMSQRIKERLEELEQAINRACVVWWVVCDRDIPKDPLAQTSPYLVGPFWLRLCLDRKGDVVIVAWVRDLLPWGDELNPARLDLAPNTADATPA